ncbi:hypothetical protein J437_LFUL006431 [Ladona fulva]|uniref:Uncharacterized protein n=1 Tax=Ladona fulva TaxID=123851 RepID=A0A8K0NWV8_LADFU|nr:hypothetical protein J437_LFUL006431 [Ladona fulva]
MVFHLAQGKESLRLEDGCRCQPGGFRKGEVPREGRDRERLLHECVNGRRGLLMAGVFLAAGARGVGHVGVRQPPLPPPTPHPAPTPAGDDPSVSAPHRLISAHGPAWRHGVPCGRPLPDVDGGGDAGGAGGSNVAPRPPPLSPFPLAVDVVPSEASASSPRRSVPRSAAPGRGAGDQRHEEGAGRRKEDSGAGDASAGHRETRGSPSGDQTADVHAPSPLTLGRRGGCHLHQGRSPNGGQVVDGGGLRLRGIPRRWRPRRRERFHHMPHMREVSVRVLSGPAAAALGVALPRFVFLFGGDDGGLRIVFVLRKRAFLPLRGKGRLRRW